MIKKVTKNNIYQFSQKLLKSFRLCFSLSWKASKKIFIIRIIIEIVMAFLPFISLFVSKEIINLFASAALKEGINNKVLYYFTTLILTFLLINILQKVISIAKDYYGTTHKDIINKLINQLIANKAASVDLSFFDSTFFYNDLNNVRIDSFSLEMMTWYAINLIQYIVQFLIASVILIKLSPFITIIYIIASIPIMIMENKYKILVYDFQLDSTKDRRKMDYLINILTGRAFAKDVRLYNTKEDMLNRYEKIWNTWFHSKRKLASKQTIRQSLLSIIPQICITLTLGYIGFNILDGNLSIGDYSLYSGSISQLDTCIVSLIALMANILDNNIRITNFNKFLEWESLLKPCGTKKPESYFTIEFKDVSFQYPGSNKYVLENLNFSMNSNEKVALVGKNGAGKSTIIKLILRYYDPTTGKILINGTDIKEYDIELLRKQFTVMFQDYANYAFTIKENITIADMDNKDNDEKVMDSCIKSGAKDLISKFDKGIDTYLTGMFEEDGKELSGGEWQKIGLARTFFRDGKIVVLDEPSAALDPEAEHYIFKKFSELSEGKGAILISHRLANIIMVDKIIVLDKTRIVEVGTHKELIERKGHYAYLFGLQAEKYKVEG